MQSKGQGASKSTRARKTNELSINENTFTPTLHTHNVCPRTTWNSGGEQGTHAQCPKGAATEQHPDDKTPSYILNQTRVAHRGQRKRMWEPRITLHVSSLGGPLTQGGPSYSTSASVRSSRMTEIHHGAICHTIIAPVHALAPRRKGPQGEQRSLIHQISRRSTYPAPSDVHLHGASTTFMIPGKDRATPSRKPRHSIATPFGHRRAHGEQRCPPASSRLPVGSWSSAGCSVSTDHLHHHHSPLLCNSVAPHGRAARAAGGDANGTV